MRHTVPTYELYGEYLSGARADPIHYETIHERSSKHDWTIRLHRHQRLAQIFLFQTPGIFIRMGDMQFQTISPTVLLIPPGVTHGFRFPEDTVGDVISLPLEFLDADNRDRVESFDSIGGAVLGVQDAPHFTAIDALMAQIRSALRDFSAERAVLLETLTRLILIYIRADVTATTALGLRPTQPDQTLHETQAQAFCAAVEDHFASALSVDAYAQALGISAPHLNRICRRILGTTPNALIRQRRMVEAQRLLQFTRHSIAAIAVRSGFSETGYFSRTFKTEMGMTPGAFRKELGN